MTRKKESYLANWYWKVKQRRGAKKAIIGLARKILIIIYSMLKDNVSYNEEIFKDNQIKLVEKREKKLIQELQKRGYEVIQKVV